MQKLLLVLFISILFGCKSNKNNKETKPVITKSLVTLDIMETLSSDELLGRNTGEAGIDMAAKFIEGQFSSIGVKPFFESYRDSFRLEEIDAFNVVGLLEGSDVKLKNEYILIGAHYDHVGVIKPLENDSIANGANDNATGTATVMMLADYFARKKSNKRSLIFALFSAEEKGLRGSKHLAKRLYDRGTDLYTVVNFEMTGVPFTDRDYTAFISGYDLTNMAEKMNAYAGFKLIGRSDVAVKYNLFKRSDNYPFYETYKIPSQTISSCDLTNYDYYHHVDDEMDKLDIKHMNDLIEKLTVAIEKMSQTAEKEIVLYE